MDVVVHIGAALLCLAQQCYPVLIGKDTPTGNFTLNLRIVHDPLYGGSVMQFKETETEVYAIHKIWKGRPMERRTERINSSKSKDRTITKGCINVTDSVYNELITNYQGERLVILK